jgi:hypothetical protein
VSNGGGQNKKDFEKDTGYTGPFTPEEDKLLEKLDAKELKWLLKLRTKERDEAQGAGAPAAAAWSPVVPYSVGPKAY